MKIIIMVIFLLLPNIILAKQFYSPKSKSTIYLSDKWFETDKISLEEWNRELIKNAPIFKGYSNHYYFDENEDVYIYVQVLKGNFKPRGIYPLSRKSPKLLMDVYVAGYPFGRNFSTGVKVTKGIISSLTGMRNNYSNIQIDAALHPAIAVVRYWMTEGMWLVLLSQDWIKSRHSRNLGHYPKTPTSVSRRVW